MIPLRDDQKIRRFAGMTLLIVLANVAAFIYSAYFYPPGFDAFIRRYAFIPAGVSGGEIPLPFALFVSLFLHGGWAHLLGNLWFLWVFGRRIEDVLGAPRFLFFYLAVGFVATVMHMMLSPMLDVPLIGASGAIAGVLGAYFVLFPFRRIHTLVPILFFFTVVRIPAVIFLGMWFLVQVLYAKLGDSPVAWWAHIGGFASGTVLVFAFREQR